MVERKVYQRFIDLPKGIQDFFMDQVDPAYDKIIQDYHLPADKFFGTIEDPVLNATLGFKSLSESMNVLKTNLQTAGVLEADRDKIVLAILQNVFWPLRDLFGAELVSYLQSLNIDTSTWTQSRVVFRPISYSGAASEVINRLGLYSTGQKAREKLRELIIHLFVKKDLSLPQVKETMTRLPDFGGLGFDKETTDKAVDIINTLAKEVELMSEEDFAKYLAEDTVKTSRMEGIKESLKNQAEDAQITTLKASMPEPPKNLTELDKAVESAWNSIPDKPTDEYLQRRLSNVISSRLRDVRNSAELLSLFQRETKVGGLGLDRAQAEQMASFVEKAYTDYHGKIEAEEKQNLDTQLVEQKHKIEERRKQEAEAHARWYEERIKARQTVETEKAKMAQAFKAGLASVANQPSGQSLRAAPSDLKNQGLEKKKFGDMVSVPTPQPATNPLAPPAAKTGIEPKPMPAAKTPTVKVSASTARFMQQQGSPASKVDGIQSGAPKLQNLVGELANLSLAQFRRMGRTPSEAAQKILQRLDTLQTESFDKRVSGIRSWQESPVMKMYMALVTDSFKTGKSIVDMAEQQRNEGKDVLTQDEVKALIELNTKLHF